MSDPKNKLEQALKDHWHMQPENAAAMIDHELGYTALVDALDGLVKSICDPDRIRGFDLRAARTALAAAKGEKP